MTLAELAELPVSAEQRTFLRRMTDFAIASRYPDLAAKRVPKRAVAKCLRDAEELMRWLTERF